MAVSTRSFTAGLNATPYTANDVVGGVIHFKEIPANLDLMLTSFDIRYYVGSIPAGMTSYRLYLYNEIPPSLLADNAAFDIPAGDRSTFIGYVDIGTPADIGSTLIATIDQINKHVKSGTQGIYGYLVTNGGYTPAGNAETYAVTVSAVIMN